MTHSMTPRSNPRLLVYYSILVLLPLGALLLWPRLPQLAGGLVIAAAFFLDFQLFRFASPYLKTKIETNEEEAVISLAGQEEVFPWKDVALSGKCVFRGKIKPFLFLYHLGKDKLITIPFEYTDMDALERTLAEKAPCETFELENVQDIRRILHERFHSGEKSSAS